MALKINLKPGEPIMINGAVLRNTTQHRQTLTIENRASILRNADLIGPDRARNTPAGRVYGMILSCLVAPEKAADLTGEIHHALAEQIAIAGAESRAHLFEAGTHVSAGAHYKALRALLPVLDYQERLLTGSGSETSGAPFATAAE